MNDLVQLLLCGHLATQGPEDGHSWAAAYPRQTCSVACGPSRQEAAPDPFCLSTLRGQQPVAADHPSQAREELAGWNGAGV